MVFIFGCKSTTKRFRAEFYVCINFNLVALIYRKTLKPITVSELHETLPKIRFACR